MGPPKKWPPPPPPPTPLCPPPAPPPPRALRPQPPPPPPGFTPPPLDPCRHSSPVSRIPSGCVSYMMFAIARSQTAAALLSHPASAASCTSREPVCESSRYSGCRCGKEGGGSKRISAGLEVLSKGCCIAVTPSKPALPSGKCPLCSGWQLLMFLTQQELQSPLLLHPKTWLMQGQTIPSGPCISQGQHVPKKCLCLVVTVLPPPIVLHHVPPPPGPPCSPAHTWYSMSHKNTTVSSSKLRVLTVRHLLVIVDLLFLQKETAQGSTTDSATALDLDRAVQRTHAVAAAASLQSSGPVSSIVGVLFMPREAECP
jgi:hypothetical protein